MFADAMGIDSADSQRRSGILEILNDFGNPLEIIREAISNAVDAGATEMDIAITVEEIQGNPRLVIRFIDNGKGMSSSVLSKDFWGLAIQPRVVTKVK